MDTGYMADFIIDRTELDDNVFLGLHILTIICSEHILIKAKYKVPPREYRIP